MSERVSSTQARGYEVAKQRWLKRGNSGTIPDESDIVMAVTKGLTLKMKSSHDQA